MNENEKQIEDIYPLSPMQQGMLFHSLYASTSREYLQQVMWTIKGSLDVSAFKQAWQRVVDRHSILRTDFEWEETDQPVQVVYRQVELPFEIQDWRDLSPAEQKERIDSFLQTDRNKGFDLSSAPLMRLNLSQITEDSYIFIWDFHHIILDGWSIPTILREVFAFYRALCQGNELRLDPPRPYRDYVARLQSQDLSQAETYWRQMLQGFSAPPALGVNRASHRLSHSKIVYDEQQMFLPASILTALRSITRKYQLTLNTIAQGAWALLLSRYSGKTDVVFGTTVSGRPPDLPGVESMVGLFINTLPVRVQVSRQDSVQSWLGKLQSQQVEMRQYEYSPLFEVHGWSEVPRGKPLFESLLVFENHPSDPSLVKPSQDLEITDTDSIEWTNYPLTIQIAAREKFVLRVKFDCQRFDAKTITRILNHYKTLLESIAANPNQQLSSLPILSEADREQVLVEWNDTQSDYPRDKCIHELFETQVEETPDAVAVNFGNDQLTYRELNQRANMLAHHLQGLGVGPEVLVGLCMERSLEMIVGLLGILKAGGAYVPLEPSYPKERLVLMLDEICPPILLTQRDRAGILPKNRARIICLDSEWKSIAQPNQENPKNNTVQENLAYVMYTSGSTGKPKGTCVAHKSIVRLVKETNYVNFGSDEVFLQFAPVSFDASTFEIWGSLLNGARLEVFPAHKPSLKELSDVIERTQVTTLWLTAGLFNQMMENYPEGLSNLRQLLAGGDVLSVSHILTALKQLDKTRLINGYGPTENTTFTCCYSIPDTERIDGTIPIGRPIANTQIYLLDPHMQPVPIGVPGELYIGGDGLARDYLHRPELTAARFVPNPFSETLGSRLYKTGDLARYLHDGNVEFLGRNDYQVKVRGFRVEPGEIEAILGQHTAIRETVVVVRKDTHGDKSLVAYVVADRERPPKIEDLRHFLLEKLPEHMIPAVFVLMDYLPLTANGKVDRAVLPTPEGVRPELESAFVAPRAPVEEVMANIWGEIIGLERIGVHDNFFELGGHSLLATRVVSRVLRVFGVKLPLHCLFEAPTVANFSEVLIENEPKPGWINKVALTMKKIHDMSPEDRKHIIEQKRKEVA